MYQNIVVPVSFEEERDVAKSLKIAQLLASEGARITVLHAQDILPAYVADHISPQVLLSTTEDIKAQLKNIAAGVPGAQTAVVQGGAGRAITQWVEENDADCIVIASHRPVISDIFLGSTAAWVVRHAPCSVHVIR